jgi:lambda family phage tail tape measure protein
MNLKVNLAEGLAPAFEYVTKAMEAHQARSQAILDRFAEIRKEAGWWAAFKDKEGIGTYTPPSERQYGSVQGANVPGIMSGIGGTSDKGAIIRQIALADAIQKANDALNQQTKTYELETKTVGQVQSAAEKLKIEYIEGGKYFEASEAKKIKAMNAAIESDKARQAFELKKMMEASQYDEKKLMIQQQYAFASQAELQYQMDILDLEKRIVDAKEKGLLKDKEAEALYRQQEMDRINRKKNIEDEQHTFEYGWRKAYENYKRDAEDAAKNAGELFDTMAKGMEDALANFIRTGKLDFKGFANLIIDEIARIEARMIASKIFDMMKIGSGGIFDAIGSIFSGGGGGAGAYTHSIFGSAGGNELGGDQPSMVGENGPELFIPRSAGTIVPNNRVGSLLGGGPSIVYNGPYIQNMSAIDTQSATQFLATNKQAVWSANQSAQRSLPQSR